MKGREFLDIAHYLTSLETEASVRSQIGRLYYAAFLEARAWCELRAGLVRTRSAREHAIVQQLLREAYSDVADNLVFLRSFRNSADSDLELEGATLRL